MEKLDKLRQLMELLQNDTVRPQEIEKFLTMVLDVIKKSKDSFESLSKENLQEIQRAIEAVQSTRQKMMSEMEDKKSEMTAEMKSEMKKMDKKMQKMVDECLAAMPQDGKDADETKIVDEVLKKIPPPEKVELDGGEKIVEKINDLEIEPDKQIDAKHIKGLEKSKDGRVIVNTRPVAYYDETTLLSEYVSKVKFTGAGVQATLDNEGTLVITIAGGAAANESNDEILTPVGDGLNFTFAHAPTVGGRKNIWLAESGQLLTSTTDYTISGSTLTMTSDKTGFTVVANYTY